MIHDWKLLFLGGMFINFFSHRVLAQIIPDATLPVNSVVTTNSPTNTITGGTVRGRNLFHSFEQFSLTTGQAAYFNNPTSIQNIFSRVTGNSISNIDGILKTNGTANLFLLNPRGIIFGANARFNLGGSFLGTTADSIKFADGTQFSAQNYQSTPLLTVQMPVGLQFSSEPAPILVKTTSNQRLNIQPNLTFNPVLADSRNANLLKLNLASASTPIGLFSPQGKTLAFVGGDVILQGGNITSFSGRIELGSVGNNSFVGLIPDDSSGWKLNYDEVNSFGNIQLIQGSSLNVSGIRGGSIQLNGKNISLSGQSVAVAANFGSGNAGFLNLNATDRISLLNSVVGTSTFNSGSSGSINLKAKEIGIQNSVVQTASLGSGTAGDLNVSATDSLLIDGILPSLSNPKIISPGGIITYSLYRAGSTGNISLDALHVKLSNTSIIQSATAGRTGGGIQVNSSTIELIGGIPLRFSDIDPTSIFPARTGIYAVTSSDANAGNIAIDTGKLVIRDGAAVSATSFLGTGQGGDIRIQASESVELMNSNPYDPTIPSALFARSRSVGGSSGSIDIVTPKLILDDAQINVDTVGGQFGSIQIDSSDIQLLRGSKITTNAGSNSNGGNIDINTDALVLDNSSITANAFSGNGGNIDINTAIFLQRDSQVTASSELGVDGQVVINQLNSPSTLFIITDADLIPPDTITSSCDLSRPQKIYRIGGRVRPLPDAVELTTDPRTEANVMIKKPDGTIALRYEPQAISTGNCVAQ
ncbi:two-partner secretion domain-containing protein [Merismopedia glauca]|uniref:Filamentous haemagglutinin FhaB/tRNA nuclease CdiA-like TPS domain-containing protein n=1 Tax=Merismopedia glauca CCAP 1448/3 TaxID=1296344 RepID=A0A2T1BZC3_9CYAN|nr:filamentous hemagglutinin N-terminal domain-containing protein [Merismopedia glauca]PSB01369.1 hypothetical protein C7B64_18710 [Merismopedia glauca CCAP 1448/3]